MNKRKSIKQAKKVTSKSVMLSAATDQDLFTELMGRIPKHVRYCLFIADDYNEEGGSCHRLHDAGSYELKSHIM